MTEQGMIFNAELEDLDALVATIEKSKEATGCPADVDLQDWVKQLAAESVALKQFPEQIVKFIGGLGSSEIGSDTKEKIELAANRIKTPATDRIVAGIKADAANQMCVAFVKHKELAGLSDDDVVTVREATDAVLHCAEVISEGADK